MSDKSQVRAKAYAREHNVSYQAALNYLQKPLREVLNASERQVEVKLMEVATANSTRVYSKVRFADVANIDGSGLDSRAYAFALKSHLDFVVTDENRKPLFAVEYDGKGHSTWNDDVKNALCQQFELPLARISHHHLNLYAREIDTITWLVEVEFVCRAMQEAQENGTFPQDEPIDPFNIYSWERNSQKFPLSFTRGTCARIHRLHDAKRLPARFGFHAAFGDGGRATGVAVQRVGEDRFLFARESIYLNGFGVGPGEVATELSMARLELLLTRHLKGEAVALPASTVYERVNAVASQGKRFHGGGYTDSPLEFSLKHYKGPKGEFMTRIRPPASLRV